MLNHLGIQKSKVILFFFSFFPAFCSSRHTYSTLN